MTAVGQGGWPGQTALSWLLEGREQSGCRKRQRFAVWRDAATYAPGGGGQDVALRPSPASGRPPNESHNLPSDKPTPTPRLARPLLSQ